MDSERNRWLIGLALSLAAIKFILMPWADAQTESRQALQVLTQRLDRSVGVVQNRDAILNSHAALQASISAARGRFPEVESVEKFRLQTQTQIGQMMSSRALNTLLFDWILEGKVDEANLKFVRARFQAQGELRKIADLQAELEGGLPNLIIREVRLMTSVPVKEVDGYGGNITFVADFYFREKAPK